MKASVFEICRPFFESLAEVGNRIKDPEALTEMVRQGLRRHITRRHMDDDGVIHFITFSPELKEQLMRALSITEGEDFIYIKTRC